MAKYLLRRIFTLLITLVLSSMIIFALTQLLPGNIAILVKGQFASAQEIEQFNERFGLNRPVIVQYFDWATGFLVGDWGVSFQGLNAPVRPLVLERLANSMYLALLTMLISVPLSILLGVIAALTEDSPIDNAIS